MKSSFISEPKTNIEILHENFLAEFKNKFPDDDINSKDYTITLIRNLMLYFYYKAYKSKIITREDILSMFSTSDISLVYKNYKNIKSYIRNPKLQQNKKDIFKFFYYQFFKIYQDNLKPYEKIEITISDIKFNELLNDPLLIQVNPFNYEIRTTQFEEIFKIINKANQLRYTASKETIRKRKIIYTNVTDKVFFNTHNKDFKIERDSLYYQNLLTEEIEYIFLLIHNYYPQLIK